MWLAEEKKSVSGVGKCKERKGEKKEGRIERRKEEGAQECED